ncbi:MAG: carboxymuconolactone decarboxylase family protein [Actinomycetota bacterium]
MTNDTQTQDRVRRGFETATKLFEGSPSLPNFPAPAEIAADWTALSVGTVMGDVWSRPGLDVKYRAVASIASLVALNRPDQLRVYTDIGLNVGLTRAEICEVVMQSAVYAGFPAAIDGLRVLHEVFTQRDEMASHA